MHKVDFSLGVAGALTADDLADLIAHIKIMVCLEHYFNTYKTGEKSGCLVNEILHFVQDDKCCYGIQGNKAARFAEIVPSGWICSECAVSFPHYRQNACHPERSEGSHYIDYH